MSLRKILIVAVEAAIVLLAISYFFLNLQSEGVPTLFGTRDLVRAAHWWHGKPILFGSELSGGGYSPGPFFYILTSMPLEFGGDWYSLNFFKYLLAAMAGVVVWFAGKRVGGLACAFWLTVVYLNAHEIFINLSKDWNASFQIFFSCLCFFGLIQSFERRVQGCNWLLCGTFGLIGISMQVHASAFIFLIVFAVLQARASSLSWKRFSMKEIALAFGVLFLTILPFSLWLFFGHGLSHDVRPPPLSSHVGLWEWIHSRTLEMSQIRVAKDWTTLKRSVSYYFLQNGVLSAALLIAIPAYLFQKTRNQFGEWTKRAAVILAAMVVIYLPFFLGNTSSRYNFHWQAAYVLFGGVIAFFPIRFFILNLLSMSSRALQATKVAGAVALIVYSCVAYQLWFNDVRQWDRRAVAPEDLGNWTNLLVSQTEGACKEIHRQTGWSADEILRRTFIVQFDDDIDIWSVCDAIIRRGIGGPTDRSVHGVHGYFLMKEVSEQNNPEFWKTWWVEQPLPQEVRVAIQNGQIEFLPEVKIEGIVLLPYRRLEPLALPEEVSNLGYGYREAPGEKELVDLPMPDVQGSRLVKEPHETLWFYYNRCRAEQNWCRTAVKVAGDGGRNLSDTSLWRVQVLGTPLSQRMSWHHQYMAQIWKNVALLVECGGQTKSLSIASQLAKLEYRERVEDFYFVTPYERQIETGCNGAPVTSVSLRVTGVQMFDNLNREGVEDLPDIHIPFRYQRLVSISE